MILIAGAIVLALFGGSVYAIWRDHEEKKAAAKRRERSLRAAVELTDLLDRQRGAPPRAPGFPPRRVG